MPPRSRRLEFPDHAVTTVLVSHDGAVWLADCTAALAAQTRPPQRVVAVDTGSRDDSVAVLAEALGESTVVTRPRDTALGAAIQAGLDAFSGAPAPPGVNAGAKDWVWVLHDDCAPQPDALACLLARAEECPSAVVIGPKVVSWDRRRLLEVGVTIDSSGFRETGLEPREVDQGQHDEVGDVLAVGTAGMLVQRAVWDALGGLDPAFPLAGDDTDFGWRVNSNGGRVVVAPGAVVRHAAAIAAGQRSTDALSLPVGAAARVHGMRTVLANTSPWLVAPLALRFLVEAVLRIVGALVLLRSPRRARDELVGIVLLVSRPDAVLAARRRRRSLRTRPHHEIRGLMAPAGWRWRHAGDAMAGLLAGREALDQRQRRRAPVETGPVAAEAESFSLDDLGVLARFLSRPGVLLFLGLVALALVADRSILGSQLHGGRLLPPTAGASDLWSLYGAGWHPVELGSTTATPPVIGVLAVLATLAFGKVWLAVDVLMLGAVPLAGVSAYLAASAVTRRALLRVVAALAYAFTPALLAGVAGGRVDVVIGAVCAPLVLRAVAAAVRRPALHRAVGAGLVLAVLVAAVPVAWPVALVVLATAVAVTARQPGVLARAGAAVATLAVAPVVLVPWTWHVTTSPRLLLGGAGLPDTFASRHGLSPADLLLLHPGGGAQPPLWVWAPIVLAALAAQLTTRAAARVGLLVLAAGLTGALLVSRLTPVGVVPDARYWTGALQALAALGAVAAALVAAEEGPGALRRRAFGWRHAAAGLLAAVAVVGVLTSALGWAVRGSDRPLSASTASVLPVFAQAEAAAPTAPRILVLRSSRGAVHFALLRGADGLRLGDGDVAPTRTPGPARRALEAAIADAAAGRAKALDELASLGVSLVVVPTDTEGALSRLADVAGLARVPATSTVVFRVSRPAGELVVLTGTRPRVLPATPGHARTTLDPQSFTARSAAQPDPARLLVLAEPYSSSWHATLNGRRLAPTRAHGWAQAWRLPADGGTLVVDRSGGHRHGLLLAEGLLVMLALILSLPSRGVQR